MNISKKGIAKVSFSYMIVRYYLVSQNALSVTSSMKQSPPRNDNIVQIVLSIARKKFLHFIVSESSLRLSQKPGTELRKSSLPSPLLSCFYKIHFNSGYPFTTITSKKFLSFKFFYQLLACISLSSHTGH
jgi:hypothetical protein